jgi:hypothetical protein
MENNVTAKDFLQQVREKYAEGAGNKNKNSDQLEYDRLIEFAKLHVQRALKAASDNAEWKGHILAAVEVDKDSILDAYPLENIK